MRRWSANTKTFHAPHGAERSSSARNHLRRCAGPSDLFFSQRSTFNFQLSSFQASGYNSSLISSFVDTHFLSCSSPQTTYKVTRLVPAPEDCQRQLPIPRYTTSTTTKRCSQKSGLSAQTQIASWVPKPTGQSRLTWHNIGLRLPTSSYNLTALQPRLHHYASSTKQQPASTG
jgi:hypothetical protein